jgi:hypothetical protein
MKFISAIAAMTAMLGLAIAEPTLTKDQVLKLGEVILNTRENKDYRDVFVSSQPAYDEKKQLWVFSGGFPTHPDGAAYVFELREKDGYYRLGWTTMSKSSSGYDRFRIAPSVKRQIGQLLNDFKQPKENKG